MVKVDQHPERPNPGRYLRGLISSVLETNASNGGSCSAGWLTRHAGHLILGDFVKGKGNMSRGNLIQKFGQFDPEGKFDPVGIIDFGSLGSLTQKEVFFFSLVREARQPST